jgi:3-methyladenine DNA glycosylase AlkD
MPKEDQLRLAFALFEERTAEDKLAGILFLQDYLYDKFPWRTLIGKYETLFLRNLIFDWNTCDWFCVRVLGPTIVTYKEPAARAIAAWRNATNLWQARSSVVPFVKVASDKRYYPYLEAACAILIQRDERFAKSAVGWLLHDISKHNRGFVVAFLDNHFKHFSIETAKNATKYFEKKEREQYLRLLKGASPQSRPRTRELE